MGDGDGVTANEAGHSTPGADRVRREASVEAKVNRRDPHNDATGIYKWYVLGLLTFINIMGSIDRTVISVIAEPLKVQFHLTDKDIGVLSGVAYSATYAIAVMPAGWLIDRHNRRNLMGISVAIWSFLTAICAVASSYAILVITRLGVGAAEAPSTPGSMSLIADIFPRERRNTAVSFYYAGVAIGQIALFLIGGWLLMYFDWRAVFLVAGAPSMLLALLLFFTTQEPLRGAFDPADSLSEANAVPGARRSPLDVARALWSNKPLLVSIAAITIGSGVPYAVTVWSTSFFVRVHHMTVSQGLIWTGIGFGLCMAVGSFVVGPLADRVSGGDPRKVAVIPAVTTIIAIAAGCLMILARSQAVAIIGLGIFAFLCGFFYAIGYSIALQLARADERGTTMAATKLITTFFGSGMIPLITGALSDAIGGPGSIRLALLFTVLMLTISAACYAWIHRLFNVK
jgi:MFS family permease